MATKETKLQIVIDAQNRANGVFSTLGRDLDAVSKRTADMRAGMTAIGTAGTVAFGALSLLTASAVKAGANFEQTTISFETMLGSAEKAQQMLKELAQFAANSTFELPQIEETSKRLLAYGVTAEELIPTLRMLGDISAGVGMDKLPQLTLAFGQVRAATKLTGMELRQFSEAGVPLLGTLAAQLGRTESEIIDMVSEGEVGFEQVRLALQALTAEGGRFYDLQSKQAATLGGQWSKLKDEIALTARAVGTELMPYLKPLLENLIAVTKAVGEFAAAHPQLTTAILVGALALAGLLAVLLPLAMALPGLIIMWGGLTAALAAFTAISAPVLFVIGAIAAALVLLGTQGYFTKETWQDVWLGIKIIAAESANAVIGIVEGMVNFIIDGVNTAIRLINRVISAAQKVPGIGKKLNTLQELDRVDWKFDTNTIATDDLAGRGRLPVPTPPQINITGNTLLSPDVAEQIGDMIMGKLKLSNAI